MMSLKEKMDSLPASKTMKIIELFFIEYQKINLLKVKPTLARYDESDYVRLVSKKLSDSALEKELSKMVKTTQFSVLRIFMEIASELAKMAVMQNGQ